MLEEFYTKIDEGCPVVLFLTENPENKVIFNLQNTKTLRELINYYYFPIYKGVLTYDYKDCRVCENITFGYCSDEERNEDFVNVCEYIGIVSKCNTICIIYNDKVNILITSEIGWGDYKFRDVVSLGKYSPRKIRTFFRLMGYYNYSFDITDRCGALYGSRSRCIASVHYIVPNLREVTRRGEKFYDFLKKENKNDEDIQ